jgi:hypothetical protein
VILWRIHQKFLLEICALKELQKINSPTRAFNTTSSPKSTKSTLSKSVFIKKTLSRGGKKRGHCALGGSPRCSKCPGVDVPPHRTLLASLCEDLALTAEAAALSSLCLLPLCYGSTSMNRLRTIILNRRAPRVFRCVTLRFYTPYTFKIYFINTL